MSLVRWTQGKGKATGRERSTNPFHGENREEAHCGTHGDDAGVDIEQSGLA